MPAMVEFSTSIATIANRRWESTDPVMRDLLQSMVDPDGPSPSIPDADLYEAERAAAEFHGKIIREVPVESSPGIVY